MQTANNLRLASKIAGFFGTVCRKPASKFARSLWFFLFVATICNTASAQSVGYVPNSTDGTVTIFGTTPDPLLGRNSDASHVTER
jgi:hypothetical protein